jgi:hypothetical protein
MCYEHARDQGTLGSVAGCRHSRTPGRTYGFLIGIGWTCDGPGSPRNGLGEGTWSGVDLVDQSTTIYSGRPGSSGYLSYHEYESSI